MSRLPGSLYVRGHGVTLVARSADKLESLATELAASGVRAEAISCDLSVRADRDALVAEVAKRGLGVSVLVNNAGLSTLGPIAESTVEGELNMVEVDVAAVVHLTTALLPQMVAAKAGGISDRGVHSRLPADPRPKRLCRMQGVRAVVFQGPGR